MNLMLAKVQSGNKIAHAIAMSGITATLLKKYHTLHSFPLEMQENSTCNFTRQDATGKTMKLAILLLIDDVSMGHRNVFECIVRSMKDVHQNDKSFGGMKFFLAGISK